MPFNPKLNMGAPIGGTGTPVQQPKSQTPPLLPKKTKVDPTDKALADALDSANQQNRELQEQIQRLTDELEGKEKELRAIQAKLEAMPEPAGRDDELANAIEARKAAEDVIDRLEREISELKASGSQTANLQKELDEALEALKATPVAKSDDTYDYLIAEREKVEEECRRLQNELDAVQTKCAELQNKLDFEKTDAESVFRLHISKIEELEEKIQVLESLPSEDEDQDKLLESLKNDLQLKDREIQNLLDEIRQIEDDRSRLVQDIRQLKAVPTTPFPVADHSACNQKIQELNLKIQKLNEELQKAYDRAQRLETTIELEQSNWVEAQERKDWAEKTANSLHKFLNEIDPEPTGDPRLRNERIYGAINSKEKIEVVAESTLMSRILKAIVILLVGLLVGGLIGHCVGSSDDDLTTDETATEATSANSAEEPPPVEVPVTVQVAPNTNAEPKPSTPPETCYPANPRSILALLNQKSDDATVFGRVQINAPKGTKRIVCAETERTFIKGRVNLAGCEICVPYGPGRYPANDSKYVSAILGRADAACYDYRARTPVSEWSDKTIHLDCKDKPDYFIPADCRDITGCDIVVPDPKKIACDTCAD
jgi:predicted  nucleic acid-binding Zn-ribbon protein